MNKEIPQQVKNAASFLINMYGEQIEYIGKYQDFDVYQYIFPENTATGFPFVFLYKNDLEEVQEITGFETFDIIMVAKGLKK